MGRRTETERIRILKENGFLETARKVLSEGSIITDGRTATYLARIGKQVGAFKAYQKSRKAFIVTVGRMDVEEVGDNWDYGIMEVKPRRKKTLIDI